MDHSGGLGRDNQGTIDNHSVSQTRSSTVPTAVKRLVTPEHDGKLLFDCGDGDIQLQAGYP